MKFTLFKYLGLKNSIQSGTCVCLNGLKVQWVTNATKKVVGFLRLYALLIVRKPPKISLLVACI
jgi:hypothetical protein